MKINLYGLLMLFLFVSTSGAETQQNWTFEELKAGDLPENWEKMETNGKDAPAHWEVREDDTYTRSLNKNVLSITNNPNRGEMGNLLVTKVGVFKNIEVSTKIKPGTIGKDAGGGLIWRIIDNKHYYLAQWNATSNSLRLYVYINGKPSLLESVSIEADLDTWHQMDVIHNEEEIEILFDNESKIAVQDKQLDFKGWIGLWAQGSALPSFDDVILYSPEDGESE
jgi:hypothetical protein